MYYGPNKIAFEKPFITVTEHARPAKLYVSLICARMTCHKKLGPQTPISGWGSRSRLEIRGLYRNMGKTFFKSLSVMVKRAIFKNIKYFGP